MNADTMRTFKTKNFTVICDATPDDDLDLSWDEDGTTREGLESGKFIAFVARVRVIHNELGELACDTLGSCIYESFDAFMDHRQCGAENKRLAASGVDGRCGSYFHDMIREACGAARKSLIAAKTIKVRT